MRILNLPTFFYVQPNPFQTAKIGSLVDIQDSEDPEGLRVFYYLVQDLKVSTHVQPLLPPFDVLLAIVSHFLAHLTPFQNQTHLRHVVLLGLEVVGVDQTGSLSCGGASFFGARRTFL